MTAFVSFLLRCLAFLCVLFGANALVPSTAWGYDAQARPSIAYDRASLPVFDYDSASTLSANENENRIWENGGAFTQFSEFLAAKGATTLADEIGILRQAAKGTGNYGLGSANAADAMRLGKAWMGEGYTVASDGKTLLSADKLRQFRPPTPKSSKFAATGVQANFERRPIPSGPFGGNGHLNIIP